MSRTYGILGWPLRATLSPAMQRAAFDATGIDATYGVFPVAPGALRDAVAGLRALGIHGASVTVPHKVDVLPLLDAVDDVARACGAVNTIVREGDALLGTNTDVGGLRAALAEARVALAGREVVVLGAGGAARAAAFALREAGTARVTVVARELEKARSLATGHACALGQDAVGDAFARAALLVQATSATAGDGTPTFVASLPVERLPADAHVTDLVYVPRETALLAAARARGLRVSDGLGLLLHQGALAFTRWTGVAAPLDAMRAALARAAGGGP